MKELRLLIIGPKPPPISGVSIANESLYLELKKKNYRVNFINTDYSKSIDTNTLGKLSLGKLVSNLRIYNQIFKIFKFNVIYIAIGQTFFGVVKYFPFLIFSKIVNKKTILHLHGGHLKDSYLKQNFIQRAIFKSVIKMADYGIVLSNSLIPNFKFFFKEENIFVVENFFEDILQIEETELSLKKYDILKVVFLSNLIEEKGINLLIKAVDNLNEKGLKIELTIAGNITPEFDSNSIKNKSYIEYLGVVSGKSKRKLLLESNVFCLPTYYKMEGQPISLIEAMATGNVILTTDHAGILDICNEKNGYFCLKNNLKSLQDTLEIVYQNRENLKDIALYNSKYANDNFRLENFVNKLETIFNKCLN